MNVSKLLALSILLLLLAAVSYFCFDLPAIMWANTHQTPVLYALGKFVQLFFTYKVWAIVSPIMLILAWVCAANPRAFWNSRITQFFLSLLVAMIFCGITKTLFGRYRPEMYLAQHLYGFSGFAFNKDLLNSMPSDHSAIIFAMVTSLAMDMRSQFGKILLVLIGLFLVATRVIFLRHYPSDVLVGMLLGMLAAYLVSYFGKRHRAA